MKNQLKAVKLCSVVEAYVDEKILGRLIQSISDELTAKDLKSDLEKGQAYSRGLMDGQREAAFNARRCHIGCD